MLTNSPSILQMCSFDANKSTKGASKLRRDLINSEIANLRDLLPLPSSTRQRLSQLQLMALVCVYVRKANYFQHVFRKHDFLADPHIPHFGFSKALSGFLMMMTQNGKLLYISDNAAEYLGHSMEDLLIHGDSVYDIIEKQDHQSIQTELMRNPNPLNLVPDTRMFLCRMNVSRNARRQMRFGDQKVVLVQGHFVSFLPLCSRNEPVFLAICTPVAMPETRECVVQGTTTVFTSIHSMNMKFIHIDNNGEFYLGYNKSSLQGVSWYELIHWDHLREAQSKHRLITQSEQERSCIMLLRLQTTTGSWLWVHAVLQVKDSSDSSQQPVIVCTNQVLSEREAAVMRVNSWLYQFYSLQSKMHYEIGYETHSTRLPSYYPTVMSYHHPPPTEGTLPPTPYHIHHHPGTPLNGSSQHPSVLQFGASSHQAGLPAPYSSISVGKDGSIWQSLKRAPSPCIEETEIKPKIPNFNRSSFPYSSSTFNSGFGLPVHISEISAMSPPADYYGSSQLLLTVPYHHQGGIHTQKLVTADETVTDVEQSLTPTNTDDVSNMISSIHYPRDVTSYVPLGSTISAILSESTRILADSAEDVSRSLKDLRPLSDFRPRQIINSGSATKSASRFGSVFYPRLSYSVETCDTGITDAMAKNTGCRKGFGDRTFTKHPRVDIGRFYDHEQSLNYQNSVQLAYTAGCVDYCSSFQMPSRHNIADRQGFKDMMDLSRNGSLVPIDSPLEDYHDGSSDSLAHYHVPGSGHSSSPQQLSSSSLVHRKYNHHSPGNLSSSFIESWKEQHQGPS
ncbi:uncharacterized protein LOC143222752 isoform X1 [Tachypleus tridentatus]|uniref:uncharacterized protein LOC143222752 isoform X1 n=2 Tax=Tachypleus tridentatus TaxID=6853 RepID=UPI003FD3833B